MARHRFYLTLLIGMFLLLPASAYAVDETVTLQDGELFPGLLTINTGETVYFENEDGGEHNLQSMSGAEAFNFGSYPQGETRSHTFENAGKFVVQCAVHPQERVEIEVTEA